MNFNFLSRKIHYWASAFLALPVLVIACSGILLPTKKHWTWVQPKEHRGTGTTPRLDLEGILASARTAEHLGVELWLFWLPFSVQRKRRELALATASRAAPRIPASET